MENKGATPDILERIVKAKQAEVSAAQREVSLDRLREAAEARHDVRPFFDALKAPGPSGVNIIAEIKRASPSKGVIRKASIQAGWQKSMRPAAPAPSRC